MRLKVACPRTKVIVTAVTPISLYCAPAQPTPARAYAGEADDDAYIKLLERRQLQLAARGNGDDGSAILSDPWTDDEEEEDNALAAHDPFAMLLLAMNGLQDSHPQHFAVRLRGLVSAQPCSFARVARLGACRVCICVHSPSHSLLSQMQLLAVVWPV